MIRSLFMCFHAKVLKTEIHCSKGIDLTGNSQKLNIRRLQKGLPLTQKVCQNCHLFDSMGEDVPKEERGW